MAENANIMVMLSRDELEQTIRSAVRNALVNEGVIPTADDIFLSVAETAKRLKTDRSTLWRWGKEGYLTPVKVGKKSRYALKDIIRIEKGQ